MGSLSLSVLVQPCHVKASSKQVALLPECLMTACWHLMGHEQVGQKGEINLHFATLLAPTVAAIRDVAKSTIPTWR